MVPIWIVENKIAMINITVWNGSDNFKKILKSDEMVRKQQLWHFMKDSMKLIFMEF